MEQLTPKQVARAIGVSDASLKRWCDKGMIESIRTAGGHRRLPMSAVMTFLRASGRPLVRPEILGLPPTIGRGETVVNRSVEQMLEALVAGDEQRFQRIVFDLYFAGHKIREICERTVAPAMHALGSAWEHGSAEIYQERRGCEICIRTLHRLHSLLAPPTHATPLAIGGTPSGDPYAIPTIMVELSLREAGWRAESLGTNLPAATLKAAIRDLRPQLVWLSVTYIAELERFTGECAELVKIAAENGVRVCLGGQALSGDVRPRLPYAAFCDTLEHLVSFANSAYRTAAAG